MCDKADLRNEQVRISGQRETGEVFGDVIFRKFCTKVSCPVVMELLV